MVFSALADVGVGGCAYPQPLAAARRALARAQDPSDPDNGGFLRAEARLLVVIVTNQDDCSVPADSDLFDPAQVSLADPHGGPGTYRCAEFGLLCDGVKPPHALAAGSGDIALDGCAPAETAGLLTPIADLRGELLGLKDDPDQVSVSLIGGPPDPVVVGPQAVQLDSGVTEDQPRLRPSCTGSSGEPADPGVRLRAWADGFTANGIFLPACVEADILVDAVATQLSRLPIGRAGQCIRGIPVATAAGLPDCQVTQTSFEEDGTRLQWELPHCDADRTVLPCWKLDVNVLQCQSADARLTVCREPSCSAAALTPAGSLSVQCQVGC